VRPPVNIRLAPDELEDEDLVEMLNAGLVPLIVIDKHVADLWKRVFPKVTVHDAIAVRTGGNIILAKYLKNAKYVKDAGSEAERKKFLDLIQ